MFNIIFAGSDKPRLDVSQEFWPSNEPETFPERCLFIGKYQEDSWWKWDSCKHRSLPFICEFGNHIFFLNSIICEFGNHISFVNSLTY